MFRAAAVSQSGATLRNFSQHYGKFIKNKYSIIIQIAYRWPKWRWHYRYCHSDCDSDWRQWKNFENPLLGEMYK